MTIDPHDPSHDATMDKPLDALLRLHDRGAPRVALDDLESRILAQAAFPLAARRRAARVTMADTLAEWVRVALPLAAAAAIFASVFLSRPEATHFVDAELHESDPGALMSALESDGASGLARHLIVNESSTAPDLAMEPR